MADVNGRTILVLALAATGFLVVGARLLESPTPATLTLAVLALVLGTAMAAAAVAGAWRPVPRETPDEAGPDDLSREDPRRRLNSGAGAPSRPSPRPVR